MLYYMGVFFILVLCDQLSYCSDSDAVTPGSRTDFCLYGMRCKGKINICCRFTDFGSICTIRKDPTIKFLSDSDIEAILHSHNEIRNEIAGGRAVRPDLAGITAANMEVLSWSRQLAYSSSCWAKQCTHGLSRCRKIEAGETGETLCTQKITDDPDAMANSAFELLHNYPIRILQYYRNISIQTIDKLVLSQGDDDEKHRQTVQLLWAKTNRVGCFRVFYDHREPNYRNIFIVCQYFPEGNRPGDPVFLRGKPCSKCPKHNQGCNPIYPNLCGRIRPFDEDLWEGAALANRRTYSSVVVSILILLLSYL